MSRCSGRGYAQSRDLYRGLEVALNLVPKIRLDACNDAFVQTTVDAILKGRARAKAAPSATVRSS